MSDKFHLSYVSKWHITHGLLRRKCLCYVFDDDTKCVRCRTIDEVKTAWPDIYLGVLESLAKEGSDK